ncbi:glycosyltransferase [Lactobacillus amylovorus]|uniref:glycosyltransferase n=1 Tax=Lactobacillus amylovorus TaxID=1604 RepID=UPI00232E0356|nr:glycosyltransferase [Lactobacillus amylovorus]MDB6223321.1 glycosyltransferase [Lactobacillus amylovorus]
MNKKKLYFVTNFTVKNPYDKVSEQVELFREKGFKVKYIDTTENVSALKKILGRLPFINSNVNLNDLKKIEDNSCIYIRYFQSNHKLISCLKRLRQDRHNLKIAIEIPTYPYDDEFKKSSILNRIKSYPIFLKDKVTRKELYKYVDRIITFSDDKVIWKIPTINISNGVNLDRIPIRNIENHTNVINMIAVAKFGFWHGYDRLIKGLGQYYQTNKKHRNVKLYLVGSGDKKVEKEYKRLITKYNLNEKVIMTGKKIGPDLDNLYNRCDLGIDSMGRYRSGVTYNSTLKGKEYLAKGLPIVSGVKTELDTMPDFKYYYRVPADDSPVDVEKIVDFYDGIYRNKDKQNIANQIRKFCQKNFTFEKCYKEIIDWYQS